MRSSAVLISAAALLCAMSPAYGTQKGFDGKALLRRAMNVVKGGSPREDKRASPDEQEAQSPKGRNAREEQDLREDQNAGEDGGEEEEAENNGIYSAPNSVCERYGARCLDTSVIPECEGGKFYSRACPGPASIRCCAPESDRDFVSARKFERTGGCAAPGRDGGPCLGGFKGVCVAKDRVDDGTDSRRVLSLDMMAEEKHHLCKDANLVCIMERADDTTAAEAMSKTDPYTLHGRTKARWDKGYPLGLDTGFGERTREEEALSEKIVDIAKEFQREFNKNGKCKTLENCGGMNPCNRVAEAKEREFMSQHQCGFISNLLADFGVVNPWCAGFTNAVLRRWKADNIDKFRVSWEVPSDPAVAFWRDWAYCHGHDVVSSRYLKPEDIRPGDLLIKSTSHIGIATGKTRVWPEDPSNWSIESIDGNTQDSGVPCADNTEMPIKHNMNLVDPGRNSGYIQYACRAVGDYPAIVRLRGFTPGGKYRDRCWNALSGMCNNDRGFKCQDPRNAAPGNMPEAFCSVRPYWESKSGSACPEGFHSRPWRRCAHINRAECCAK